MKARLQNLEDYYVVKQEKMIDAYNKINHNYNNNNGNKTSGMPCQNSPRRMAHIARPEGNDKQIEMKMVLLQIQYANPFAGLDHEDSYIYLTMFYDIYGMLWASETEEEVVLLRLFPYSLIGKTEECYLDQPTLGMPYWDALEEKFLNIFFTHNKFMEAKTTI